MKVLLKPQDKSGKLKKGCCSIATTHPLPTTYTGEHQPLSVSMHDNYFKKKKKHQKKQLDIYCYKSCLNTAQDFSPPYYQSTATDCSNLPCDF